MFHDQVGPEPAQAVWKQKVIFKSGLLKRLLERYCHGVAYPAGIYMTIFVEVVNMFAIFENNEFLHSLDQLPTYTGDQRTAGVHA